MLFICEVAATNLRFKIVVNLRESGNSLKTFEKEIFTGGHFWTRWRSQVELGLRLLTWWDVAPVGNFLAYLVREGFQKSKCKFKMDFSPKGLGSVLLQSIPLCYFCYIYLNNFKVGGSVHWQNASLLPPLLAMAAALILIFTKVATVIVYSIFALYQDTENIHSVWWYGWLSSLYPTTVWHRALRRFLEE